MRQLIREMVRRGRQERAPGGIVDGHLAPCPRSPNCVSSQAEDPEKRMEPIAVEGPPEEVLHQVRSILEGWRGTEVVQEHGRYLHAECHSFGLGFVDDLEFLLHENGERLDFRSVSRIGYSDLGANRRRMERFVREMGRRRSKSSQ